MKLFRLVPGASIVLVLCLAVACGSGGEANPDELPTGAPTAQATIAQPTPTQGIALPPAPAPGIACPTAVQLCEFAVAVEAAFKDGNADALLALAHSVTTICADETGPGSPSEAVCQDAAPGEERTGFWDLRGGLGHVVTAEELRAIFDEYVAASRADAGARDSYGDGALRIASISCARQPDQALGTCLGVTIQVHMTFINPANSPTTGPPGQRTSFHVSASVVDGQIRANGIGSVNPPNRVLASSTVEIQSQTGEPLVVEVYPWTR